MLVLASASPRRQELLRNAGITFEVQPAHIPEDPLPGEAAKDCAERLAREKALAVARQRPHDCVLGADTIVAIDDQLLGKPSDAADAARMLRLLSGREHRVITGVCLVVSGQPSAASETTLVTVSEVSDKEIAVLAATFCTSFLSTLTDDQLTDMRCAVSLRVACVITRPGKTNPRIRTEPL